MDRISDDPVSEEGSTDNAVVGKPVFERAVGFGSNPGNLTMRRLVATSSPRLRPLVVALHGCSQSAEGFARSAGWARLAERHDFLLLLPEQTSSNNQRLCFSWFEPGDTRRGGGEVASIHQMIATMVADHGADPAEIFVTGLSAGGAMAGAMLATYPETFAGGAIIAGLPFGTASGVSEALDSMFTGKVKEPRAWGDAVRGASAHAGPWPRVAIWHGTADTTVKPINAGELVKQWTNVHGIGARPPEAERIGPVAKRTWRDGQAIQVIEYSVPGLGHGVPTDGQDPAAPFFIPIDLSSSEQICQDWGLLRSNKSKTIRGRLGIEL